MQKKRRIRKASPKRKRSAEKGTESFAAPASEPSPVTDIPDLQAKKRILVIDSEEIPSEVLEIIPEIVGFEHQPCEVLIEKDGEAGLRLVRKEGGLLDLIICALKHYCTSTTIIKKEYPDIPLVFCGGFSMCTGKDKKILKKLFFKFFYEPFSTDCNAPWLHQVDQDKPF